MNTERVLENIADRIIVREGNDLGLLSGAMGDVLFLFEYSRFNHIYRDKAESIFNIILDRVQNTPPHYSYCSGLAGIGMGVLYLKSQKLISDDFEIGEEIDEYLHKSLASCIDKGNYDFLHGAIGIAFYFIERFIQTKSAHIKNILIFLMRKIKESATVFADKNKSFYAWCTKNKNGQDVFDLSLAHGCSHIILLLCRLYDILDDNYRPDLREMIIGAVEFVLHHQLPNPRFSYYPYSVRKEEVFTTQHTASRLSWCYGDFGIVLSLIHADKVLPNHGFYDKAKEIALFMTKRRNLSENLVVDPCFCHGASGVSAIFAFLYKEIKNKEMLNSYFYWLEVTNKMLVNNDNELTYFNPTTAKFEKHEGMLTGVGGVGIVLLSSCYKTIERKLPWGKLFLLE